MHALTDVISWLTSLVVMTSRCPDHTHTQLPRASCCSGHTYSNLQWQSARACRCMAGASSAAVNQWWHLAIQRRHAAARPAQRAGRGGAITGHRPSYAARPAGLSPTDHCSARWVNYLRCGEVVPRSSWYVPVGTVTVHDGTVVLAGTFNQLAPKRHRRHITNL